jgi:hypothetical protein
VVDVNAGKKTFTSDPCMLAAKLSWNYGVTFAFTHGVMCVLTAAAFRRARCVLH